MTETTTKLTGLSRLNVVALETETVRQLLETCGVTYTTTRSTATFANTPASVVAGVAYAINRLPVKHSPRHSLWAVQRRAQRQADEFIQARRAGPSQADVDEAVRKLQAELTANAPAIGRIMDEASSEHTCGLSQTSWGRWVVTCSTCDATGLVETEADAKIMATAHAAGVLPVS